ERQLVEDSADSEPEEPGYDDPIAVGVTDQPEIVEEAPDCRAAERETARPQHLPNPQHPDIFVLLPDEVPAHRRKDSDERQRRDDRADPGYRPDDQLVLEAIN